MKKILLLLILICTLSNTMGINKCFVSPIINNAVYVDCEFDIIYNNLVSEVDNYINKISPSSQLGGKVIVDMCLKYDIDIMFVLAQGQIESHFGTTGTARKTNSVFNVGAFDGYSSSTQIKKGYGFEHPNDSVEPYLILLSKNYLVNNKNTNDLMYNYVNKYGQRYASNTYYEKMMRNIYNRIDRTTNIKYYQTLI